jgi:hypothetical protein
VKRVAAIAIVVVLGGDTVAGRQLSELERQRLVAHLDVTAASLVSEVQALSPRQLAFKRSADEWSIAQVIDHLILVGQTYWDDLQTALKSPRVERPSTFSDADILWYGIDRTNREKAIATELPAGKFKDRDSALAEYRRNSARLIQFVRSTDADLRAHLVPRQGSDAYQWALLISTHEQRHILQIREIKMSQGFPADKPD